MPVSGFMSAGSAGQCSNRSPVIAVCSVPMEPYRARLFSRKQRPVAYHHKKQIKTRQDEHAVVVINTAV
jgi:hypothetical protein